MMETSSPHLAVLLPASPGRCYAFGSEPTVSRAEQLWPAQDPVGPFVVTGFSAETFPVPFPACCPPPLPGPLAQFSLSAYMLIHFIWVLFFPLPFNGTEEAFEFCAATGRNESMGWV